MELAASFRKVPRLSSDFVCAFSNGLNPGGKGVILVYRKDEDPFDRFLPFAGSRRKESPNFANNDNAEKAIRDCLIVDLSNSMVSLRRRSRMVFTF